MTSHVATLHFVNVQAHKETILHLSEGLNVIKGTSHHGKSCLARGVEWLLFNRPLAPQDKIKSWFASEKEEISVTIEFSDGTWVSRTHNKDFNGYLVGGEDGEEMYEALRGEVPEEVLSALNMDSINYRGQHEGYFMLNSTSGEVARLFNQSAGLDIIDTVRSRVDSVSRETNSALGAVVRQLEEEQRTVDELSFVRGLEKEMLLLNRKVTRSETLAKNILSIKSALSIIKTSEDTIERAKAAISLKSEAEEIRKKIEEYSRIEIRYNSLSYTINSIQKYQKIKEDTERWLTIKGMRDWVRERIKEYDRVFEERRQINSAYATIDSAEKKRRTLLEHVENLKEQRSVLHTQLDYCPECGAHRDHWRKDAGN